jgi:peptide/nickel transport system permease protein
VAPDISLGQIISEYNEAFKTRPWLFWYPGLFIVLIALAINFVGDGLRDAFDPRQRRLPRQGGAWKDFKKLVAERGKK